MNTRLLAFLLLLTACTCNQPKQESTATDSLPAIPAISFQERLVRFAQYTSTLDSTIVNNNRAAVAQFQTLFAGADSTIADSAFYLFRNFHLRSLDYEYSELIKDTTDYTGFHSDSSKLASASAKVKVYLQKLQTNGFALKSSEGLAYIVEDFDYLVQNFSSFVSTGMKEFLEQQAKEAKEGYMDDGGLLITPKRVANRIIIREGFRRKYPHFIYNTDIAASQRELTTVLLEGVDNTPLFDYDTKKVSFEFVEAYEHVLKNYPSSNLATIVKPYYQALKQNNTQELGRQLKQLRKQGVILDFSS